MGQFIDLTGHRFGRLVAKTLVRGKSALQWRCQCDCGMIVDIFGGALRRGDTLSCGCLKREVATTHGMTGTTTYWAWQSMMQRCYNPKNAWYSRYGGRGINVCERWHKLENFVSDMGTRPPKLTLERINNELGYSKSNCKWATWTEQARNRSSVKLTELEIERIRDILLTGGNTDKEIGNYFGVSGATIWNIANDVSWL
jgi:hypothetical protein